MTEMLERYKLEIVNNHGDRYIRCEPAPDGSWVMFKDATALQARVAELEARLRALLECPVISVARHHDPDSYCDETVFAETKARATLEAKKDE